MRTLILYSDDNGQPCCGCIIHDGSFDPANEVDVEWKDQLTGFAVDEGDEPREFFAVQDIDDAAADNVYATDSLGNEIGKQYIQR